MLIILDEYVKEITRRLSKVIPGRIEKKRK